MKILILGGTGAMGNHLAPLLAAHGHSIFVSSRSRSGSDGNIKYLTGNAQEAAFISTLLEQTWDAIIDFMVYSTAVFAQRNSQFLSATGHYIYLSSSRVYAHSEQPLTENAPRLLDVSTDQTYLATDEYALTKARQENILFESSPQNWSIVRPYITYSDQRLQLGVQEKEDWLYRALNGRSIADSQVIQSKVTTLTYGQDVARAIAALLGQPSAQGEAFHITSDYSIRWSEVLDIYLNVLQEHTAGRPAVILQDTETFMRWRSSRYQVIYDRFYDRRFDNRKINQYINTSDFVTPQAGLTESLRRFISAPKPRFQALSWKAEAIKDRLFDERTPLEEIPGLKQKAKYTLFRHFPIA